MHKLLLLFLLCFPIGYLSAQDNLNQPEISLSTEVIDYGMLEYNDDTEREIIIKNTGKSPLIIKEIKTECNCTIVNDWSKDPIPPGKTSKFKVKYDSKRVGRFEKKIAIISNAKNGDIIIVLRGNVRPVNPGEKGH